jgi:hypothetical protein
MKLIQVIHLFNGIKEIALAKGIVSYRESDDFFVS